MVVSFYIPTNTAQGLQFLHIFTNACYLFLFCLIVVILMDVKWSLIVVLYFL